VVRVLPLAAAILLAGCGGDQSEPPESEKLSPEASRYYRSAFFSVGAFRDQADCATEALVSAIGVSALERHYEQASHSANARALFPDLAEAASECDIESGETADLPGRCLRGDFEQIRRPPCVLGPQ
jgi:hypothetical protein